MDNTQNNEFQTKVRTLVEGLGFSLDAESDSTDKKAVIMNISDLKECYSENKDNIPHVVITFQFSEWKDLTIVLFDKAQINSGLLKLIDASYCFENTPFLLNLIYHQAYPGEYRCKYEIDEDETDDMCDHWDEYVQMVSYTEWENNNYSWFPSDYNKLPKKDGFEVKELIKELNCSTVGVSGETYLYNPSKDIEDKLDSPLYDVKKENLVGKIVLPKDLKGSRIDYTLMATDIPSEREGNGEYRKIADKEVVVVSRLGDLKPTLINARKNTVYVPLSNMVVIDIDMEEIDAEYLVKELQKDYVKTQIEDKQRNIMNDREYILDFIKIYVPLDSNGQSSIEKQKECVRREKNEYITYLEEELEKERAKYLKKYKDICDYCKEENLKSILIKLEKDEISDDSTIFNGVRKILEWVQKKSPACLTKHKNQDSLNNYSREIGSDREIPTYIQRSFHTCVQLGNEGSHYNANNQERNLNLKEAPYLAKSIVYSLLNILNWCKNLDKNN